MASCSAPDLVVSSDASDKVKRAEFSHRWYEETWRPCAHICLAHEKSALTFRNGDRGAGLAADMIAPVIGLVTVAVLLYLVFAALFGSTAGVVAVAVLAFVGFLGFVGSLIVSMR
jgi:hypothetical protein